MSVTGQQLISGQWQPGQGGRYRAINPAEGAAIEPELTYADEAQIQAALVSAEAAAPVYAATSPEQRARFLDACADEVMALGDTLSERVMQETGYPKGRAEGERGRTCGQLKMFARHIRAGDYLDARIDSALPDREPMPRPDIRFCKQPIGPVVVFGSSNFPLAFSAAGGDTASALAAGCPVIVKSHNSHPGSGELVAQAVARAVRQCDMPAGVFQFLSGAGNDIGATLVSASEVKAVGFTGSYRGGMALHRLANERPEPIPFFAEMGSINPVVLLPEALQQRADTIAEGFVGSLSLGTGQFCVNPGLVAAVADAGLEAFSAAAARGVEALPAGVMLNEGVAKAYQAGVDRLAAQAGVSRVAAGEPVGNQSGFRGQAALFQADAKVFLSNEVLQEEIFGPSSLIVRCADEAELQQVVGALQGQLSGTLQATEADLQARTGLISLLQARVGRLVVNGFPTGVEVCDAMMHGGPFPAASDSRFTSVGTAAIDRFLRPGCYQNMPEALLPPALRSDNPWQLRRLVEGEWTQAAL
ncbi:aldehyde dehydrogenase (NADP(+)) [Natronospirillum operosum]|uniref:Aldehyde dehydrogenase (NADP(+)) n=1 Tax=Natronospirillum operosum TaxID=2759953 RepID=A0A4Z0W6N0_9GAMM|nr:aldehyde dehydrogenase (NADP(+)) [Natronospirillum operosum]TGG93474.1 aldehyde dehydrogenase (NADP(+)) [Natronospirillum operosum]